MEKAYDFRKKLLQVHEPDIRNFARTAQDKEFFLPADVTISINKTACEVVRTSAMDFADFLRTSMGISASVIDGGKKCDITVELASDVGVDLGEYAEYRGFSIETDSNGIRVYGHDARGAAQGLYYLEDVMSFENAPAVPYGTVKKKPMFSPQMVHSGYGLDKYPDEHLARIAHEGRDVILVFTKDVNETPDGYLDFNDLIRRAARYGLDVYAYSYMISDKHPDEPDAEEYYENTYGRLFRECPGLTGVTLVGESVEFPSKDPNIAPGRGNQTLVDGVPTGKNTAGWWPCYDYPQWLDFLKRIIRKYKPDADIVFWTYNWGARPKEYRLKLIENLPTDISLQATFEMYEPRDYYGLAGHISDYTLAFEGPGAYFESEAEVAAKRGIRLYSMTNTGGMAWDLGVIPYEPMPYQWMKRYEAMRKAQDDWGLCGIMESHHYGMYPSFITKLSKWCFWEPREDVNKILEKILKGYFGKGNYEKVDEGMRYISDAIRYFTPNDADQYGAFRVGPAYPFNLERVISIPSDPKAMFGNRICFPTYDMGAHPLDAPESIRVPAEKKSLETMLKNVNKCIESLEAATEPNKHLDELINLCKFIACSVQTGINAKEWHLLKCRKNAAQNREELAEIYDNMEALLKAEIANAEKAIPLVEADSRLGWEPSMLYIGDKWHIEWKIRQVNYVINSELALCRKCLNN